MSAILVGAVASPVWASFEDWARAGEWRRILDVASRRVNQLPLSPEEAMVAAHAARALGDRRVRETLPLRCRRGLESGARKARGGAVGGACRRIGCLPGHRSRVARPCPRELLPGSRGGCRGCEGGGCRGGERRAAGSSRGGREPTAEGTSSRARARDGDDR